MRTFSKKRSVRGEMRRRASRLTAVDLFAGGGGLSVGLKRAGMEVVAAVELDGHAFATYKTNHPEVAAYKQDIRTILWKEIKKHCGRSRLDLMAGCPPCQGFTSLTVKYRRTDPRNRLIDEMARLIEEARPRTVMMENVPRLASTGKALFDGFVERLIRAGYLVRYGVLQVADFGVPQSRRRLVLLAGKGFEIPLPQPTHDRLGRDGLPRWRTVRSAIGGLPEPHTLLSAKRLGGPTAVNWHVVRQLSERNIKRIRYAAVGRGWSRIPKRLRPDCQKDQRAGFSNVYGRMAWDQESPTITGGCTTFSKGRFGHPSEDRTISALEAALLQTFPKEYVFDTPYMEYVCEIIGNALPCEFAEVLARQCVKHLRRVS